MFKIESKFLVACAVAVAAVVPGAARQLSFAEAMRCAPSKITSKAMRVAAKPVYTEKVGAANVAYVVNNPSNGGYVVLSADDVMPAVLGYADSGSFDPANVPPSMAAWLSEYGRQLSYAMEHGYDEPAREGEQADHASIAPLMSTLWNQSTPFNNNCPTIAGSKAPTGCTATAISQVVNYHKWPESGEGVHTYTYSAEGSSYEDTYDFGATTFDWANMRDDYGNGYTPAQAKAVATLMRAVGNACKMGYGKDASSSYPLDGMTNLVRHMKYDKSATYILRDYYTAKEWDSIIYNELANNRPVSYSGVNDGGGHAFVVDGYSEDGFYHLNWGWGGLSNGYFRLYALDPASQGIGGSAAGYNYWQDALINLMPQRAEGSDYNCYVVHYGALQTPRESYPRSQRVYFRMPNEYFQGFSLVQRKVTMGLLMTPVEGGEETFVAGETITINPPVGQNGWMHWFDGYYVAVSNLPQSGSYNIVSAYQVDGTTYRTRGKAGLSDKMLMSCDSAKVTFKPVDVQRSVKVSNFVLNSKLYTGKKCSFSATIANTGEEFVQNVTVAAVDSTGAVAGVLGTAGVRVSDGQSVDVNISGTFAWNGQATAAGKYSYYIVDENYNIVDTETKIEQELRAVPTGRKSFMYTCKVIDPAPGSGKGSGTSSAPYEVGDKFVVDMTIKVTTGFFDDTITFFGYDNNDPNGSWHPTLRDTAHDFLVGAGESEVYRYAINTSEVPMNRLIFIEGYRYATADDQGWLTGGRSKYWLKRTSSGLESGVVSDEGGIAPNPATDVTTLTAKAAIKSVEIYNLSGVCVQRIAGSGDVTMALNVAGLASGHYVVLAGTDDGMEAYRLVVK